MALCVREGNVRVRIYEMRNRVGGKEYTRWELRWRDIGGVARSLKRSRLAEAKAEARRIVEELARGGHAAELSLADLASFRAGVVNLCGTGRTLETATAELAEAARIAPDRSMVELARFWVENRPKSCMDGTVQDMVAAFLAAKVQQGLSDAWLRNMRSQLERFAVDFAGSVGAVTASKVQAWHLGLKRPNAEALLHPRTRNNHLASVQALFNGPGLRAHPEKDGILDLKPIQCAAADNAIWKPEEFRLLLETAWRPWRALSGKTKRQEVCDMRHLIPILALGGWGRIRATEIRRLRWDHINLDEGRVLMQAGLTKTRRPRLVELPPCAVAWLRHFEGADGQVWPWGSCKFNRDLRLLAARCGLTWRDNALRNSAVTYDQVRQPDLARVSAQAGNSPSVLERQYLALSGISKATADEWFAIYPPQGGVIVPLDALSS